MALANRGKLEDCIESHHRRLFAPHLKMRTCRESKDSGHFSSKDCCEDILEHKPNPQYCRSHVACKETQIHLKDLTFFHSCHAILLSGSGNWVFWQGLVKVNSVNSTVRGCPSVSLVKTGSARQSPCSSLQVRLEASSLIFPRNHLLKWLVKWSCDTQQVQWNREIDPCLQLQTIGGFLK